MVTNSTIVILSKLNVRQPSNPEVFKEISWSHFSDYLIFVQINIDTHDTCNFNQIKCRIIDLLEDISTSIIKIL